MFFRKLCRNSVFPTEERSSGLQPSTSAATSSEQTASGAAEQQVGNRSGRADLRNLHRYPEEVIVRGHNPVPLTPPPSYSAHHQYPPPVAVANRYEYAASTSSDESNYGSARNESSRLRGSQCPDLLHACSLILPSQRDNESSDRELTERRRRLSLSSSDYAEIDEICGQFSQLGGNNDSGLGCRQASRQDGGCLTSPEQEAMGQNLSLRRPRISLTWVLREQQSSNPTTPSNETSNDKKKLKTKGKEEKLFSEKYVSNHNLQEYQDKREPCKDLLFVCTPQKQPVDGYGGNEVFARRRSDICRNFEKRSFKVNENVTEKHHHHQTGNDEVRSLKGTYSEPSLIAASEGNHRRHRHRKRRDRNRLQKFGYEIRNVDEFLSKCSLASPGNIPVVLSSSSTLYQTRPGGYQIEVPLPLGMVVNAVFKNQNWLYVQTPHAEEGYVGYSSCLPLGILPPAVRTGSTNRPPPCWESNGDVFPRPCGNMTDSEKEVRLRGGTRSDGARTPRSRRSSTKTYGEHHVDKLYLRAASQPKLTEKSYAQLKPTLKYRQQQKPHEVSQRTTNDEYVVLQQKAKQPVQKSCTNVGAKTRSLRQTLVAITNDYATDSLVVHKGDIVTLLDCRESKDRRQWFYIKARDGREGFIPAEFAGHGFL